MSRIMRGRLGRWIVLGLVILAVMLASWRFVFDMISSQVNTSQYQAVFLSNNQVYFGKLHGYYTDRPYMTDVYYFQSNGTSGANQQSSNQQLVKLGKEVHGPNDTLILTKNSIVFVENLRDDSNVTTAIKKDKDAQSQSANGITR